MNKRNFFYDILRDTGSIKFSMTKFLALLFSTFLIIYLSFVVFLFHQEIDHALVVEFLGIIGGLVGLKNNWGVNNGRKSGKSKTIVDEPVVIDSKTDNKEEGVF